MIKHFSSCQMGRDLGGVKGQTHRVIFKLEDLPKTGLMFEQQYQRLTVECANCGQSVVMDGLLVEPKK